MSKRIGFIKKNFTAFGGAELYLSRVMERLALEDIEVHVIASQWAGGGPAEVHLVEARGLGSAGSVRRFNESVAAEVERLRLDCVLSFERTTSGKIYRAGDGVHARWLELRRKVEGPLKSLSFSLNPLHRTLLALEREIFQRTPVIIANSLMVRHEIMKHYGVPGDRIRLIYNGVDTERFRPDESGQKRAEVRARHSLASDAPVILYVGSGFERKGLGRLIEAMHEVHDASLIAIGKGDISKYERMARRAGVAGRVLILGPRPDVIDYYQAADVFALPTMYDPFSNATIEAMACGLPVVTTVNNGASEIMDDKKDGCIVKDFTSVGELSYCLNLAVSGSSVMGAKARSKAMLYPLSGAVDGFVSLIKECTRWAVC